MQVEICVERLFLNTFLTQWVLLSLVNERNMRCSGCMRRLLAAFVGTIVFIAVLWMKMGLIFSGVFLFVGTVWMLWIAFPFCDGKGVFLCLEQLVIAGIFFGGGVLLLFRFCAFFSYGYWKYVFLIWAYGNFLIWLERRLRSGKKEQPVCKARFCGSDGKEIILPVILDTGNRLREPISHRPVCVWKGKGFHLCGREEGFRIIPFQSVGKTGLLEAYFQEKCVIQINGIEKTVYHFYVATDMQNQDAEKETGEAYLIFPPALLYERERKRLWLGH